MIGKVKWFNNSRGYGFIQQDGIDKDIFVHISQLEKSGYRTLKDGQKVSFELYDDRGRTAAGSIKIII